MTKSKTDRKDIVIGFDEQKARYFIGAEREDCFDFITVKNGDPCFVGQPIMSTIKVYHGCSGDIWYMDFRLKTKTDAIVSQCRMNSKNFAELLVEMDRGYKALVFETYIAGGCIGIKLSKQNNTEGLLQ